MKNYKLNVEDYIDSEFLEEELVKIGEELSFLPEEEREANFCKLESVISNNKEFNVTFAIENEWTGEKYKKSYQIKQGSKIGMNKLLPNLACFLPPVKVPVLVEIIAISTESLTLKTVGVLQTYADEMDKNAVEMESACRKS